ncbi:hypothetical protein CXB51_005123 [Gossypium anomalum]|uniref:Uncharacterized protein n=1 Tax=Gossypium anomalum TaxID=47600 RepID=A0A8J6D876_9ROSI|nr:hypothetical protein CXB51_005123 [Gossypium anomalum]
MANNQNNLLPPVVAANPVDQNPTPRTMYDYAKPTLEGVESSIVRPAIAANNFELKPNTIQMIQQFVQFDGLQDEDPNTHLANFLELCDTFKINGISDDVQTFYNGVNPSTRQLIDATAGGTLNNKEPEEAYEFVEEMALNNYQWQVMRMKPKKAAGVFNLDEVHPVMRYDSNGGGVHNTDYPSFNPSTEEEQVHYMGNNSRPQNNLYSNTYNVGWRNHPNFSWGGQGNQRPQHPPGFQQSLYQQEKKSNLEEMFTKFISVSETHFQNIKIALKNQQASIQGLETQIGQLAKLISERPQSGLPSNTETNPREQLHTIAVHNNEVLVEDELKPRQDNVVDNGKVNMPNAVKFLKGLLANKRKLDDASHVELNAVCSAILQNRLPKKLKDPGSFTIPCLIGSLTVNNTLADLGASINIMPYKMFKQLGLGKPKQTRMSIQLADKTIRFPRGIIEDVLVKIDKFIFPVDFVVLDIDEDSDIPLILGRPFLATARTIIDVGTSESILRVGDDTIKLQARDSAHISSNRDDCLSSADMNNIMAQTSFQETPRKNEKPKVHDESKRHHDEYRGETKQFKVGDKVLLDEKDPRIATLELNTNGATPFTVLNVFPYSTVKVNHSQFGTFKVNITQLRCYVDNRIDSEKEESRLRDPP